MTQYFNTARKAYDIFGDYLGGPTIDEAGEITYHDPPPVHHTHKRFSEKDLPS